MRRAVDDLLAAGRLGGLLLTGPAGIGKTAIWEWSLSRAASAGWRVLSARAAASEASLPWVGLTDLVERCRDEVWDELPEPLRDGLDVAMLRTRAGLEPPDERAIGAAFLAVINALASRGPVLLALDDVAYLDPASTKALRFALRRIDSDAPVRIIATARDRAASPLNELSSVAEVVIEPLAVAGVFELVRYRLGLVFSRPTLVRIVETSGGNALYALEIARALDRREIRPVPGLPLGLPDTLRSLVADRIMRLDAPARTAVAATYAVPRLLVAQVDPAALATALAEMLVQIEDGLVRASHPLVAAAAYASLSDAERVELHQRLAGDSADPIERARHLALAVTTPDPDVAAALDEATKTATARGAADAAAQLARLALERTERDAPARVTRLQTLADMLFRAGDVNGAISAQRESVDASRPGDDRARQLIRLAEITVDVAGFNAAVPLLQAAIDEGSTDPQVTAEAHLTIAAVSYDDLRAAKDHAMRALELIESLADPDPAILSGALSQAGGARFRAGFGLDRELFRRAIELEKGRPTRRLSDRADASLAALLKYADELDEAAAMLAALLAEAETSGDIPSVAYVRSHLPQLALYRGDIAAAREYADAFLALADSAGLVMHRTAARFLSSLVAVHEGRTELAQTVLDSDLAAITADGNKWDLQRILGALGSLAWAQGDAMTAATYLGQWFDLINVIGLGEPGYARYHLDYAEALVAVDRLDEADAFLDTLMRQAEQTGRASAAASVGTGRAAVSAARGDTERAQQQITDALRCYESLPLRFDRARCLLVAGQIHRRARAKLAARDALTEAVAEFTAMGTPLWADRAAGALARVNIRPSSGAALTATELRVAELAARGWTNREVAAATFISPKTVEANLVRVYRKLGISSRAELGAKLGQAGTT